MPTIRVGISGWTYPEWRGGFYPRKLPQKQELHYASRALSSIEINGTFHSLQKPTSFQAWYDQTPEEFKFAVKGGKYLTHILRAKECESALCNFFASGLLCLKEKLGPILWQFPPNVMLKDDRFEKFVNLLPHDAKSAAKMAKRHSPKLAGRVWTEVKKNFPLRHAFEFRHPSFQNGGFYSLLKENNVALAITHGCEEWPFVDEVTADVVYVRLLGDYKKGYPAAQLKEWANRARSWVKEKKEVYLFVSEEQKVFSPRSAQRLMTLLEPLGNDLTAKAKNLL